MVCSGLPSLGLWPALCGGVFEEDLGGVPFVRVFCPAYQSQIWVLGVVQLELLGFLGKLGGLRLGVLRAHADWAGT